MAQIQKKKGKNKKASPCLYHWLMEKPDEEMTQQIETAVHRTFQNLMVDDVSSINWIDVVPKVIEQLKRLYPIWIPFKDEFQTHKNPCYAAIYQATRNYTRRKPAKTRIFNQRTVANTPQVSFAQNQRVASTIDEPVEIAANVASPQSKIAIAQEKPAINIAKNSRKQAIGPLQNNANAPIPTKDDDSDDYDYSAFIAKEYWESMVKMKRNIKFFAKQLKAERKALNNHFAKMASFFHSKDLDSDE